MKKKSNAPAYGNVRKNLNQSDPISEDTAGVFQARSDFWLKLCTEYDFDDVVFIRHSPSRMPFFQVCTGFACRSRLLDKLCWYSVICRAA
jgi:hypothetical protein